MTLPPKLAKVVAAALVEVADGHAVHISRVDEEVTTSEAAEILNVSRPYLVRLLDEGAIPHRKVGTHRRVRRADVLAYREQAYQVAEEALQELADQAQERGLEYEGEGQEQRIVNRRKFMRYQRRPDTTIDLEQISVRP